MIKTTTPDRITAGMTILKYITDGHYYGTVHSTEVTNPDAKYDFQHNVIVYFTDGDTQKYYAGSTVIVKE